VRSDSPGNHTPAGEPPGSLNNQLHTQCITPAHQTQIDSTFDHVIGLCYTLRVNDSRSEKENTLLDYVAMMERSVALLVECGRDDAAAENEAEQMVEFEKRGAENADRVLNAWCGCEGDRLGESEYFVRPNGAHGWFHPACRGITQTG
jgi:hypothetical protein